MYDLLIAAGIKKLRNQFCIMIYVYKRNFRFVHYSIFVLKNYIGRISLEPYIIIDLSFKSLV